VPIAGSKYQVDIFRNGFETPFFMPVGRLVDDNYDGFGDVLESYLGYRRGAWRFDHPAFLAAWRCTNEVASQFQDGWLAAQRDDAVFLFAQQRAVMTATGSWDASSIASQVGDRFRIGVFDFPVPTDHPAYAPFVRGPMSEAAIGGGLPWSITRQSRHAEVCLDFLRFCTTRANNERLNLAISWLPVVQGSRLSPELEPFRPRLEGFSGGFDYRLGTPVKLLGDGERLALFAGRLTPEQFAAKNAVVYEQSAAAGYTEELDKQARNNRNLERILGSLLARAVYAPGEDTPAELAEKSLQVLYSATEFNHNTDMRRAQFAALAAPSSEEPQP
jgi:raffinose/stachyose/melibiose transport system substrate-binding protein